MATPIIGYGAGGHATSLIEAVRTGPFELMALADDDPGLDGRELLGTPIVAGPQALETLRGRGVEHAFVGVGGVVAREARVRAFARIEAAGYDLPQIVHASAVVSEFATLGRGVQILATAVVNAAARLADGVIVNTGAIVEHDCVVDASAHLGPGATLGGNVTVGAGAHVGMGAVVVEGLRVGTGAFVAAGAVVTRDVADGANVRGVPAR